MAKAFLIGGGRMVLAAEDYEEAIRMMVAWGIIAAKMFDILRKQGIAL